MRILPLQFIYMTIFAIFGVTIFKTTGYLIYDFMDISKKENCLIMLSLYPIIVIFNGFVVMLDKIKNYLIKLIL